MKIAFYTLVVAACIAGCARKDELESSGTGTIEPEPAVSTEEKRATAQIEPKSGSNLSGEAVFVEKDGEVTLTVNVSGAEPGIHGIHLHEKGDCSAPDATSAGGHWNPTNEDHGKIGETTAAHSGDMGNLEVNEDGTGTLTFTTDRWSIGGDSNKDVVGKAIVVHAKADDLMSQPTGDSGDRIGCGVISQS